MYSQTIWIIYDCPIATCTKLWLRDGLISNGYDVKTIEYKKRISHIEQRGKVGKILARMITLGQCMKAIALSKNGDLIICWSQYAGLLINLVPGVSKRRIISFNWLTPNSHSSMKWLYAKALRNKQFTAVINAESTKGALAEAYGVQDCNTIFIPDVFDDKLTFRPHEWSNQSERYVFMGGRAYRDWNMFFEMARRFPDIGFCGVAPSAGWDNLGDIPKNVTMHFDVSESEYYRLMEHAYITMLPLTENKVAGLINIARSIQYGVIPLTSDIEATRMYYPDKYSNMLVSIDAVDEFYQALLQVYDYSSEKYDEIISDMQRYLDEHFSPQTAIEELCKIIGAFL